ncbi:hypothetical protein A5773_20110 [Mycobacterium sp. 852014-52450_SCH5900713]|uniref:hypothetical protein n=1 Tax=Mycobacterium sp. 852014-52450_SCH5900713 TaxID=1834116 RepID=UPI0007FE8C51|nr:hypothetical protein [Mycobacterium sp. 852014-52450_SCH5900713]OBF93054.1 hypothetical protein A5773_20110 [Mycobacterium sp. 852014-52450_SCH5900713]
MASPFAVAADAAPDMPDSDAEVLPAPLAAADAKRLDMKLRLMAGTTRENFAKLAELVDQAKHGQVHLALGFVSWTAYLADAVGGQLELTSDARREVVALMAGEGMSLRAIATATGVSKDTVHRDLGQVSHRETPDDAEDSDDDSEAEPAPPVTGLDGKTYAKRKDRHAAQPLTATFRRRLEASRVAVIKLHKTAEADTFDPASLADDAEAIRSKIDAVISALTEVRAQLESV